MAISLFRSQKSAGNSKPTNPRPAHKKFWRKVSHVILPYLLIDCVVVVIVNAAYVFVAVNHSDALLFVVQTLLSVFKVVWGRWTLPSILAVLTRRERLGKVQIVTQILVNILNNIVIPCLVVAVVSPSCFFNALVLPPPVSTIITYESCVLSGVLINSCTEYKYDSLVTSFNPPFTYSYQCSSSLITYYAPAFVSMCIVSTFGTPLAQYVCLWLHRRTPEGSKFRWLLDYCLPKTLRPVSDIVWAGFGKKSILRVGGGELVISLISTLGLILTFGVMFPPLCIALVVTLLATVLLFRVNVEFFVNSAAVQYQDEMLSKIRTGYNSVDCVSILNDSIWVLVTISCWFYTFFLFDTLGDAVGLEKAYWVLIVMPLMPLVMYIVHLGFLQYHVYIRQSRSKLDSSDGGVKIEMQTTRKIDYVREVDSDSVVHNIFVNVDRSYVETDDDYSVYM